MWENASPVPGHRSRRDTSGGGLCREPRHSAADETGPSLSKIAAISALTAITIAVTASSECADDPR